MTEDFKKRQLEGSTLIILFIFSLFQREKKGICFINFDNIEMISLL